MSPAAVQSAAAEKHGRSRSRKKKNNVNTSSSSPSLGKKRKSDDDDLRMEKPNKKSKGKVQLSNGNEVIAAEVGNLKVGSGIAGVTASYLSDSRYVSVFLFLFINLGFFIYGFSLFSLKFVALCVIVCFFIILYVLG